MKDYLELTKPRITCLIVMSTVVGYYFGRAGLWSLLSALHSFLGTALIASGTAALNQWYERDADIYMRRTQVRPLPVGRLQQQQALMFGIALSLTGGLELGMFVNWLTAALAVATEIT